MSPTHNEPPRNLLSVSSQPQCGSEDVYRELPPGAPLAAPGGTPSLALKTSPHRGCQGCLQLQSPTTFLPPAFTLDEGHMNLLHLPWYDCSPLQSRCIPTHKVVLAVNLPSSLGKMKMYHGLQYTGHSTKSENHTLTTEFVLQGFSSFHEHQLTLFVMFLAPYILTLAGNIIIVIIIRIDHHLHTPMYFFLSMLSTSETIYTLVILPRMLSSLVGMSQSISLAGCATQMFFFVTFGITNCFLLTAMGYDRYVAICRPLRYTVIMNRRVCIQLVWGACSIGLIVAMTQVTSVFRLPFCATKVAHFFCDIRPVMKLSCIDTTVNEILTLIISVFVLVVPMGLVFISYILIISTILKIASAEGRKKAFATCASHLTVVIVHYGCASIAYLKPKSENSKDEDQLISVTYTVVTPLLNPVVYTLRNKEAKDALLRAIGRKLS
ncbi:olfactory receptor 10J1-like [Bos indicus x Bos taurus]|uniref:olfactory receptor 10J1-like n=1 Tax=Bos indicus x Bos taurus TaxID=30522 RepID=UPI000F7D0BB8|nr:olfactory receptor 10J1-like [Bos indicus x Bos taurus]